MPRGPIPAAVLLFAASCSQNASAEARERPADGDRLPTGGDFVVGVQTHFGQNWPNIAFRALAQVPLGHIRDGLSWQSVEREKGQLSFDGTKVARLERICSGGANLLLTVVPRNPLYDGDRLVNSPEGRAAFIHYLDFVLSRLKGCVDGLEIGNEINSAGTLRTNDGSDGKDAYVALIAAISAALKSAHPEVAIVGGSSNAVGTGFLASLFERGLLDHVDAIAVHPYRPEADGLAWELRNLTERMAEHGTVRPVWATEFGDDFATYEEAAPAVLKMLTVLSAAGVERAYWYALIEQSWFPRSGLYSHRGRANPAADAMALFQSELAKHGRAREASPNALVKLFAFGTDRWVAWGAPTRFSVSQGTVVRDARGRLVRGNELGAAPLLFIGQRPQFAQPALLADSFYQFDDEGWSYHAIGRDGREVALAPLDSDYMTSMGSRFLKPLRIGPVSAAVTGTSENPVRAIVRYDPAAVETADLRLCLQPNASGQAIHVVIRSAGTILAERLAVRPATIAVNDIALAEGTPIDLVFSPGGQASRGNTFNYRVQLAPPGTDLGTCPDELVPWGAP